jgi:hypothetical protein
MGKRCKFVFVIKGVVESMEKTDPPTLPPAGDIVLIRIIAPLPLTVSIFWKHLN